MAPKPKLSVTPTGSRWNIVHSEPRLGSELARERASRSVGSDNVNVGDDDDSDDGDILQGRRRGISPAGAVVSLNAVSDDVRLVPRFSSEFEHSDASSSGEERTIDGNRSSTSDTIAVAPSSLSAGASVRRSSISRADEAVQPGGQQGPNRKRRAFPSAEDGGELLSPADGLRSLSDTLRARDHMSPSSRLSGFKPTRAEKWILRRIPNHWNCSTLFLLLLGTITAVVGALMDIAIDEIANKHLLFTDLSSFGPLRWLLWMVYFAGFLFVAVLLTRYIAPTAAGSGIPEMKSILGGAHLHQYLSARTLLAKVIGLPLAVGSGAFLGKEGPFVHMSSIVARQLARMGLFYRIRSNQPLMMQMLSAGIAVGVAANFGAPVGGVLFSIEVTSTYYPIRNYWSCYLAALPGALLFRYIWNAYFIRATGEGEMGFKALLQTSFDTDKINYGIAEILIFVGMGMLFGLLGIAFIRLHAWYTAKWAHFREIVVPRLERRHRRFAWMKTPYFFALFISVVTAFFSFPGMLGTYMGLSSFRAAQDLFANCSLGEGVTVDANDRTCSSENRLLNANDWGEKVDVLAALLFFGTVRYLLTPASIMLQVPLGMYTPVLASGAAFGRFIGEIVDMTFPDENGQAYLFDGGGKIAAGGYAVAGAAALCAGTTHTLSSAVILFELTGQIHHLMPTLVAVVVAVAVSKKFSSLSIYDSIGRTRGLPYLPDLQQSYYDEQAGDIMIRNARNASVTADFVISDIVRVLSMARPPQAGNHIPVVTADSKLILIGAVDRNELVQALDSYTHLFSDAKLNSVSSVGGEHDGSCDDSEDNGQHTEMDQLPVDLRPGIESAIQVFRNTSLSDVHLLLMSMYLEEVFVTDRGQLVGVVSRDTVKRTVAARDTIVTIFGD